MTGRPRPCAARVGQLSSLKPLRMLLDCKRFPHRQLVRMDRDSTPVFQGLCEAFLDEDFYYYAGQGTFAQTLAAVISRSGLFSADDAVSGPISVGFVPAVSRDRTQGPRNKTRCRAKSMIKTSDSGAAASD